MIQYFTYVEKLEFKEDPDYPYLINLLKGKE